MTVKLRYKQPDGDTSTLISRRRCATATGELTANLGFASAVAEFGMLLRRSEFKGRRLVPAQDLARRFRGDDPDGYRAEFVRLSSSAAALDAQNLTSPQSRQLSVL